MNEDNHLLTWILGAWATIVTALVAVIKYLYGRIETQNTRAIESLERHAGFEIEELKKRSKECEDDRTILRTEQMELKVRLAKLEHHIDEASQH